MGEKSGKTASVRNRIRTAELIEQLQEHAKGNLEMSASQVRAAEILLAKRLPNRRAKEAKPRPPGLTLVIKNA